MSTFLQRTLSGTVYVGLVIASILVHPLFFGVLFLGVTMLAVREQHVLLNSSRFTTIGSMLAGGLLFVIAWMMFNVETMNFNQMADVKLAYVALLVAMFVYAVLLLVLLVAELWLKAADPIRNWGNILLSQIMIALPFALMNVVMGRSKFLLLALFITIWVNDTGAYCVGSSTAKRKNGNHKMFPRVSPAKSWEGLFGGFVFALLAGYIYYKVGWFAGFSYPMAAALVFALLIAVAGTFGDLMESLMKRTIGVKDSGKFLPGHGGVLDRFDSILLATPVVALLLYLL